MDPPNTTDLMSAIGTVVAAVAALVAAPAAVYDAIQTRRAADASARAATEAANQAREIQVLREPRAVIKLRVPDPFGVENYIKFGRGNNQFRSGPPVCLDVWNGSGPTIMVMEVSVKVSDSPNQEGLSIVPTLTPQLLVESGKVASINVAYQLLSRVSSGEFIDFPDLTEASAHFSIKYFSSDGERSVEIRSRFKFRVSEEHVVAWIEA